MWCKKSARLQSSGTGAWYIYMYLQSPLWQIIEKCLDPVTLQLITSLFLKKTKLTCILNIFHDKWPMIVPSLIMATAYQTLTLVGSLEHLNSFPTATTHLSLYT